MRLIYLVVIGIFFSCGNTSEKNASQGSLTKAKNSIEEVRNSVNKLSLSSTHKKLYFPGADFEQLIPYRDQYLLFVLTRMGKGNSLSFYPTLPETISLFTELQNPVMFVRYSYEKDQWEIDYDGEFSLEGAWYTSHGEELVRIIVDAPEYKFSSKIFTLTVHRDLILNNKDSCLYYNQRTKQQSELNP